MNMFSHIGKCPYCHVEMDYGSLQKWECICLLCAEDSTVNYQWNFVDCAITNYLSDEDAEWTADTLVATYIMDRAGVMEAYKWPVLSLTHEQEEALIKIATTLLLEWHS